MGVLVSIPPPPPPPPATQGTRKTPLLDRQDLMYPNYSSQEYKPAAEALPTSRQEASPMLGPKL